LVHDLDADELIAREAIGALTPFRAGEATALDVRAARHRDRSLDVGTWTFVPRPASLKVTGTSSSMSEPLRTRCGWANLDLR